MRVFISWSGEASRSIAQALRDWLPMVVQHIESWMSDEDIDSGARWNEAIGNQLEQTNFGIVCVTRANQLAPWLLFEAGALAKSVENARVVPLRIDLPQSDLRWPLAAFQGLGIEKEDFRKLVHALSVASEKPMADRALDQIFERMWPDLKAAIDKALRRVPSSRNKGRTTDDMLREVVAGVRRVERILVVRRPRRGGDAEREVSESALSQDGEVDQRQEYMGEH